MSVRTVVGTGMGLVLASVAIASAQSDDLRNEIERVRNDISRVDTRIKSFSETQQAESERVSNFRMLRTVDPISDQTRVLTLSTGDSGKTGLEWRCETGALNVLFMWDKDLPGVDDRITVQHRFPPEPAASDRWSVAANHRAASMPDRQVKAFTARALAGGIFVVRVENRTGDAITDTFKLDGLSEALTQLPCANRGKDAKAEGGAAPGAR